MKNSGLSFIIKKKISKSKDDYVGAILLVVVDTSGGSITRLNDFLSNHYSKNKKQVILVGKEYFKALDEQYQKIYQSGLLQVKPSELYTLTDDVYEVIQKAGINPLQ